MVRVAFVAPKPEVIKAWLPIYYYLRKKANCKIFIHGRNKEKGYLESVKVHDYANKKKIKKFKPDVIVFGYPYRDKDINKYKKWSKELIYINYSPCTFHKGENSYITNVYNDPDIWVVSPGRFMSRLTKKKKVLKFGYPKNDLYFRSDNKPLPVKLKHKVTGLYMPSWDERSSFKYTKRIVGKMKSCEHNVIHKLHRRGKGSGLKTAHYYWAFQKADYMIADIGGIVEEFTVTGKPLMAFVNKSNPYDYSKYISLLNKVGIRWTTKVDDLIKFIENPKKPNYKPIPEIFYALKGASKKVGDFILEGIL